MKETPHKTLLPREEIVLQITAHFQPQLDLLEEMVNYVSKLVPRAYESSGKKLHDFIIVHNFVKQAACILDGVSILAAQGAVVDATILLRSLIELSFHLEWIFQKNTEERGLMYYVWHIRVADRECAGVAACSAQ